MRRNPVRTLSLWMLLLLFPVETSISCINTTYSRKHEKQVTGDLPRLINGQFATHGDAFYRQQLQWTERLLELQPKDYDAKIDRAAALLKLQQFADAEALLNAVNKEYPSRYKTHANLGVLYKKMGEFEKAVHHTQLALDIKPGGHLGLGDYYLRMLNWRSKNPYPNEASTNFLGVRYEEGPQATASSPLANEEFLKTLIIADRHFADTYFVLGDVLFVKKDYQNALRSYHRAFNVLAENRTRRVSGSKSPSRLVSEILFDRFLKVEGVLQASAQSTKELIYDHSYDRQILQEYVATKEWLDNFKRVEAALIEDGVTPDFDAVKLEMKKEGVKEPVYLELAVFEGKENAEQQSAEFGLLIFLIILLLSILALLFFLVQRTVFWISRGSLSS